MSCLSFHRWWVLHNNMGLMTDGHSEETHQEQGISMDTPLLPNKSTHSGHAVLYFPTPFRRLALYFFSDSVITKIHILIELCKIQTSTALNISVNTSTHLPTAMPQILAENWGQSWQLLGKNFLKLINKFSLQATQKSSIFLLFLLFHVNFLNHCLSLHSFLCASGHIWAQEQGVLLPPVVCLHL